MAWYHACSKEYTDILTKKPAVSQIGKRDFEASAAIGGAKQRLTC
jgi:hypothetical protein